MTLKKSMRVVILVLAGVILYGLAPRYQVLTVVPIEETTTVEVVEEEPEIIVEETVAAVVEEPVTVETQQVTSRGGYTRPTRIQLDDRETLARLVYLESRGESDECQKAVVSVVINRLNSGYWGDTIESVVYAANQFTPAKQIPYTTPTERQYANVDYVLENGSTLPSYVLYFRAGYHFSWKGYEPYIAIDNTYFGYMTKDRVIKTGND